MHSSTLSSQAWRMLIFGIFFSAGQERISGLKHACTRMYLHSRKTNSASAALPTCLCMLLAHELHLASFAAFLIWTTCTRPGEHSNGMLLSQERAGERRGAEERALPAAQGLA